MLKKKNFSKIKPGLDYFNDLLNQGFKASEIKEIMQNHNWPIALINEIEEIAREQYYINLRKKNKVLIKVLNLTKSFGKFSILKDVSFEVHEGDFVGIIGMSGSGKTTLLHHLIGLHIPDNGGVYYKHPNTYKHVNIKDFKKDLSRSIGFAPQEPSFYEGLSVLENLKHFSALYGKADMEYLNSLIDLVDLTRHKHTLGKNLSGGMQRRLGITTALAHKPKILIMDEPTADLDPLLKKDIWNLMQKVNQQGTSIIFTSHFLDEVELLSNKIGILHNAELYPLKDSDELRKRLNYNYELSIKIKNNSYSEIIEYLNLINFNNYKVKDGKLYLYSNDAKKILIHVLTFLENKDFEIEDLEFNRPKLEEVFEELVKR